MGWDQVGGDGSNRVNTSEDKVVFVPGVAKRLRVLDAEPFSSWTHYVPNTKGIAKPKGLVINCPGKSVCPACASGAYRTKMVHVLNVYDVTEARVRILEAGNMIMKQIKQIHNMFGTLNGVILVISRTGTGTSTTYMVMPMQDAAPLPDGLQLFDIPTIYAITPVNEVERIMFDLDGPQQVAPPVQAGPTQVGQVLNQVPIMQQATAAQPPAPQIVDAPQPAQIQQPPQPAPEPAVPAPTVAPVQPQPDSVVLDFGKYAGKTIDYVASVDMPYISWLVNNAQEPIKTEAKKMALAATVGFAEPTFAPAQTQEGFIAVLEADKTAENYKQSVAETGNPPVTEAIADNIDVQLARIQKTIQTKYSGNFAAVMTMMQDVSKSAKAPAGKATLATFTVPELNRLEESLGK